VKRALIFGVTGQDGSYLAENLLAHGYEMHGVVRRSSSPNLSRLNNVIDNITLHYGDLSDTNSIHRALEKSQPDEVYNLGAQSHVAVSFENPEYTADVTGSGTVRLLEAIRGAHNVKYYQASSSEMFGSAPPPQSENTPFHPRSPYGCAKVFSYWLTVNYREAYGMHASNGILFNHESPRRGESFVTRKIAKAVARIARSSNAEPLRLGNLDAKRDWGHARDYVEAQRLILQADKPDDYVIATGQMYSVRDFCREAFAFAGLDWQNWVVVDKALFRPAEVDALQGDSSKARKQLGWEPKISFRELVHEMVNHEMQAYAPGRPKPN
jgi:GDPmannose 4,6-dehydratase